MPACNIPITGLEIYAANRTAWRQCPVSGVRSFDEQRLDKLDAKLQARKNRSVNPTSAVACLVCGQICESDFGLQSHQRCHWQHHCFVMDFHYDDDLPGQVYGQFSTTVCIEVEMILDRVKLDQYIRISSLYKQSGVCINLLNCQSLPPVSANL